jgi:hypothetical protein
MDTTALDIISFLQVQRNWKCELYLVSEQITLNPSEKLCRYSGRTIRVESGSTWSDATVVVQLRFSNGKVMDTLFPSSATLDYVRYWTASTLGVIGEDVRLETVELSRKLSELPVPMILDVVVPSISLVIDFTQRIVLNDVPLSSRVYDVRYMLYQRWNPEQRRVGFDAFRLKYDSVLLDDNCYVGAAGLASNSKLSVTRLTTGVVRLVFENSDRKFTVESPTSADLTLGALWSRVRGSCDVVNFRINDAVLPSSSLIDSRQMDPSIPILVLGGVTQEYLPQYPVIDMSLVQSPAAGVHSRNQSFSFRYNGKNFELYLDDHCTRFQAEEELRKFLKLGMNDEINMDWKDGELISAVRKPIRVAVTGSKARTPAPIARAVTAPTPTNTGVGTRFLHMGRELRIPVGAKAEFHTLTDQLGEAFGFEGGEITFHAGNLELDSEMRICDMGDLNDLVIEIEVTNARPRSNTRTAAVGSPGDRVLAGKVTVWDENLSRPFKYTSEMRISDLEPQIREWRGIPPEQGLYFQKVTDDYDEPIDRSALLVSVDWSAAALKISDEVSARDDCGDPEFVSEAVVQINYHFRAPDDRSVEHDECFILQLPSTATARSTKQQLAKRWPGRAISLLYLGKVLPDTAKMNRLRIGDNEVIVVVNETSDSWIATAKALNRGH